MRIKLIFPLFFLCQIALAQFGSNTNYSTIYSVEAQNYFTRVASAGGTLTAKQIQAVNLLINDLKACGAWQSNIIESGVSLGGNVASAKEKIKYPGGASSALSSTGTITYVDTLGLKSDGTSGNYLATINPITYGATTSTLAYGVFITNEQTTNTFLVNRILTNYESGATAPTVQSGTSFGFNPNFSGALTYRIGYQSAFCDVLNTGNNFTQYKLSFPITNGGSNTGNYNVPITFFKSSESGTDTYGTGSFSSYWIGKNVNQLMACKIAQAYRKFERLIGRDTNAKDLVGDGDSITVSTLSTSPATAWATKLSSFYGLRNGFHGVVGLTSSAGYANIFQTAYEYVKKYVWLFGANDINNDALKSTTGTSSAITTYASNITNTINALLAKGMSLSDITICTPPYNTVSSTTCQDNYANACTTACASAGVTCVDVNRLVRNYDVSTLIGGDGLHYTDGGNELLYKLISGQTPILFYDNFNRADGALGGTIPGTSIAAYASNYSYINNTPWINSSSLRAGNNGTNGPVYFSWNVAAYNIIASYVYAGAGTNVILQVHRLNSSNYIYIDAPSGVCGQNVAGTITPLISGIAPSVGDTVKAIISGTTITIKRNSTSIGTTTFSSALQNSYGIACYLFGTTASIDDIIIYSNY